MTEQATKAPAKLLKKMTPKTIMGERPKVGDEPKQLFTIYGVASGVRKGESNYGPWTMLTGRFEAARDGQDYISGECALPNPLHNMIIESLRHDEHGEVKAVEFACNVIIAPRPDTAIGYEYFAEPIVEQTENDPLSSLRARVTARLAIPAPKAEAQAENPVKGEAVAPDEKPTKGKK